jgi:hypothetical protein
MAPKIFTDVCSTVTTAEIVTITGGHELWGSVNHRFGPTVGTF